MAWNDDAMRRILNMKGKRSSARNKMPSIGNMENGEMQVANVPGKGVRLYAKINNALYSVALTKQGREDKEE